MKYVSLFSGIGGFDLGFDRARMECVLQVENDPNCLRLLESKWSNVKRIKDVKDVKRIKSIDLVCGGFPCQDVSVAGKRAGLAGKRSGLWFEFHRIIERNLPRWVVVENVPGLLSSNNSKDIQIIIDDLTQLGYTVDIDIKDAQEFGLAQRRRRVFLTCVRLDASLKWKTSLSRQISADLLAQILLNAWGAIQPVSSLVPLHSVFDKPVERCVILLRKMTQLLEVTQERLACKKFQNGLDALLDQFGDGDKNSTSGLTKKSGIRKGANSKKTAMSSFVLKVENGDMSISSSLKNLLDAVCKTEKRSITSTSQNPITDYQIYTFAVMALSITKLILLSTDWSESYWSVASSLSTLLQENINYARQASNQLFIEPGLRDCWGNYLNSASGVQKEIERCSGIIRAAQVLFESEGVSGDTPPGRETGQEIAATIRGGSAGGSSHGKQSGADEMTMVTGTLSANRGGLDRPAGNANELDFCIPIGFDLAHITRRLNYSHPKPGDPRPPLNTFGQGMVANTLGSRHVHNDPGNGDTLLAWNWQSGGDVRRDFNEKPMLQSSQVPAVGVRRLTPLECTRLQGFPDDWLDGLDFSDSVKYRQLGNAVAVPVATWIGQRIVLADGRMVRQAHHAVR